MHNLCMAGDLSLSQDGEEQQTVMSTQVLYYWLIGLNERPLSPLSVA